MIIQTSNFEVTSYEENYVAKSVEEIEITINKEDVERITQATGQSIEETIELLAGIEQTRKMTSSKHRKTKKIDNDTKIESIIMLLQEYSIEIVTMIFAGLKYYQIKEILEDDNPREALSEKI